MLKLYDSFWNKLKSIIVVDKDINYLKSKVSDKLIDPIQGDYPKWFSAYENLPSIEKTEVVTKDKAISCIAHLENIENNKLNDSYRGLMPWRKGPFNMFSTSIDSEWLSYLKWNRIENKLPTLKNKSIMDVGCGNGYYMFRMLRHSPSVVMGIDPGLLQVMQFWSVEKYVQSGMAVLPLSIQEMPKNLKCFDMVFSMGVLYHRKSPIHHLKELASCMKSNGDLVLETLVVKGDETHCLIPTNRYAQMRNVWFLPSVEMLTVMLERSGFKEISCIDVTYTTTNEQRTTDWMRFHSLKEFLNEDQTKTIEGYDLPLRATLIAKKK